MKQKTAVDLLCLQSNMHWYSSRMPMANYHFLGSGRTSTIPRSYTNHRKGELSVSGEYHPCPLTLFVVVTSELWIYYITRYQLDITLNLYTAGVSGVS